MGLLPGVPSPSLSPDVVLVLFLPPLVYAAAVRSSVDDLRANAAPILRLAIGLVLVTVGAVAVVGHVFIGLPWAVAFVLGAVVGPTDTVAASAMFRRLGAPERIVTILEGESLVNDGTGITAYVVAVATVTAGAFSLAGAVKTFAIAIFVGIALGLAVGWLAVQVRRLIDDTEVELALTLLTPFVAYIPAEELGGSGVLGAVAAGLYAGSQLTRVSSVGSRVQLSAFWELLEFLLNALLFLLIGEQLPHVVDAIGGGSVPTLVAEGLITAAAMVTIRMVWMFSLPAVAAALHRGSGAACGALAGGARTLLGWSGMRGAVSLALLLAVPSTIGGGRAFPHRAELVFVGYVVVVVMLVGPGLTVGALAQRLGLLQGQGAERQEARARAGVLHAALARIESLAESLPEETADRLRAIYQARLNRVTARLDALARLSQERAFPTHTLRDIGRELDLEELRTR
jgi:CPA1 family monovalent cation:H+ antiporter